MESVSTGMSVVTTSGRRIGVVIKVRKNAVLLGLLTGANLWIKRAAIFTVEDGSVTLICEEYGLHRYVTESA